MGEKNIWERIKDSSNCRVLILNLILDSCYGDGFWYEGWEGHFELVKLNLHSISNINGVKL